jgi:pimeloyl-ACP methyl ester carboxylesterase
MTDNIHVLFHGPAEGPSAVVLHGGPGAAGHAADLAAGLAQRSRQRVLEPHQRGSGGGPLSVARHVADLHDVIRRHCGDDDRRPALVGESWGAMLALAYAAEHPEAAGPIALVGCGTFDLPAREQFQRNLEQRMTPELRGRIEQLDHRSLEESERLREKFRLIRTLYEYEPDEPPVEGHFDYEAHRQTWEDMLRLQGEGVYPKAFAAIRSPVLMLHGDYDPHPGEMIRQGLLPHLPELEYFELPRCGHSPWREKHAREAFYRRLINFLLGKALDSSLRNASL